MKPFNIVRNNIKQKARRCGVTEAAMTQVYLQERLIARVASSEYGRNLILKGGLCMAMILGIHSRTTIDSDYNMQGIKLTEQGMLDLLNEIILIDLDDSIKYSIIGIDKNMPNKVYYGVEARMKAMFGGMEYDMSIDIATGDYIVPKPIMHVHKSFITDDEIHIHMYTAESIVAEKLDTVVYYDTANTRGKDFYDIYMLIKMNKLQRNILRQALSTTFETRGRDIYDILPVLKRVSINADVKRYWERYSQSYDYSRKLEFNEVMRIIVSFFEVILS